MIRTSFVAAAIAAASFGAQADLYDQNVTPGVIFGSGNANGGFTTDTANGLELALRGKLRHDPADNQPKNVWNSNGDGTYSFVTGGPNVSTAVWSFEWSINTDTTDSTGLLLRDYTYALGIDKDASQGVDYMMFDLINGGDPTKGNMLCWDHSMGTNATTALSDSTTDCSVLNAANREAQYAALLASTVSVAQNSWKPSWFIPGFDPTVDGTYNIFLSASNASGEVARTDIQIIVGQGGAAVVPEPASLALFGVALAGLVAVRRRKQGR